MSSHCSEHFISKYSSKQQGQSFKKKDFCKKEEVMSETIQKTLKRKFNECADSDQSEPNMKAIKTDLEKAEVVDAGRSNKKRSVYIFGNYRRYYEYRNNNSPDPRLDALYSRLDLFKNKRLLDIGCNNGFITVEIAKRFGVRYITGFDIDDQFIKEANSGIKSVKKRFHWTNPARQNHEFPYNITFRDGNYVLRDDILLEMETPQFDTILCLSVTKWIHLNFGDNGLKQAFRRMYAQLVEGGALILEAQPFDSYKRRKTLTVSTQILLEIDKLLIIFLYRRRLRQTTNVSNSIQKILIHCFSKSVLKNLKFYPVP